MPTAFCSFHPDLEAVARCKGCRKMLCSKCRNRGHDGWYCGDECMKKQAGQQQTVQVHDEGRKLGGSLLGKLVPLVILAAVAGAGYWVFVMQGVRSIGDLQNLF